MREWLSELWIDAKHAAYCVLLGTALGATGAHFIEAAPLIRLAVAGACAQQGIQTVAVNLVSFYNCQDAVIANHIQTQDALAAASEADPIGDIIRASEKKGKVRK